MLADAAGGKHGAELHLVFDIIRQIRNAKRQPDNHNDMIYIIVSQPFCKRDCRGIRARGGAAHYNNVSVLDVFKNLIDIS